MKFTSTFLALAAAVVPLVSAAPAMTSRAHAKRAAADIVVFKFADVLEQLESAFYAQALSKFKEADFNAAGFTTFSVPAEQFLTIQSDESTHSTVLQAALRSFGEAPITNCKFNFDAALTDVATVAATARIVENVGVSAYIGGSVLLTDPVLLAAAAGILTIEARHSTVLNILSGSGTAVPAAFDFGLTPNEVLALAGGFFDGPCDIDTLGLKANPALAITNTGSVGPGTKLTFSSPAITGDTSGFFCQMMLGGASTAIPLPFNECIVPDINGPVAIFITSDNQPLVNNVRDRDTIKLVAGPTLAFIDTKPQTLGALARGGNTVIATATISPEQATSIILGATSTAAPTPTATPVAGGVPLAATANRATGPTADGLVRVEGWSNFGA